MADILRHDVLCFKVDVAKQGDEERMSECYNCHEQGHFARECPEANAGEDRGGYAGGRGGRGRGRGRGRGERCYRCNRFGHLARDCRETEDRCYRCGKAGHIARECPNEPLESGVGTCYNCGQAGHMARECPEGEGNGGSYGRSSRGAGVCYSCRKPGHLARDCRSQPRKCFTCGETGHFTRNCPHHGSEQAAQNENTNDSHAATEGVEETTEESGGGGGAALNFTCSRCNQAGHVEQDCPVAETA